MDLEVIKINQKLLDIKRVICYNNAMNIKNKTQKDTKIVSTYQTKLTTLTSNDIGVLDDICVLFCDLKRNWTSYSKDKNADRTKFVQRFREPNGESSFSYRFFQGVIADVKGLKKSIDSNRKNYIQDKKVALKKQFKVATKRTNAYKNAKNKNEKYSQNEDIAKLQKAMQMACAKRDRIQASLDRLTKSVKEKSHSICYGSKSLLKKRNRINTEKELVEWQEEWFYRRTNSAFFVGSSDEKQGCSNAQLYFNEKTKLFDLQITIPNHIQNKMLEKGQEPKSHLFIRSIKMPKNGYNDIKNQVLAFQNNKGKKEPFSFRFVKDKSGDYTLNISTRKSVEKTVTSDFNGVVGMDINPDNLSVAEIDRHGNLIKSFVIDMKLEGNSSEKRANTIGLAVKELMDFVEKTGKNLVIEKLDFKKKKRELVDNFNPKYAAMLSGFAYAAITNNILRQGMKRKIEVIQVNPAYTSLLGKVNFQLKKGISIHEAAAYAIGRRNYIILVFYHFFEKKA